MKYSRLNMILWLGVCMICFFGCSNKDFSKISAYKENVESNSDAAKVNNSEKDEIRENLSEGESDSMEASMSRRLVGISADEDPVESSLVKEERKNPSDQENESIEISQLENFLQSSQEGTSLKELDRIHKKIIVEAGTLPELKDFFLSGEVPVDAVLDPELTYEQVRVPGTVYGLLLRYNSKTFPVHVEIVDTTPPIITGAKDITIYKGDSVAYKKGITLSDNADGEVSLSVEKDKVNLDVVGKYPVCYVATDMSGNTTEKKVTLNVVERPNPEEEVDALADALLAELITDDMTKWDICYQLWDWCRSKIKYTYTACERTLYVGAYEGLQKRSGDCYVYYATFTVLLQKCGIETIEVRRVGGTSDHWWNLVNLGDGWYHCDSSPRKKGHTFECFMQTDAQIQAYTEFYTDHPNYYTFDGTLYPERETKIVYGE